MKGVLFMEHSNFERYSAIHNELIKRLQDGEITIEFAKEVNDLAFDKYISEKVDFKNIANKVQETKNRIKDTVSDTSKKIGTKVTDTANKLREVVNEPKQEKAEKEAKLARLQEEYNKCATELRKVKNDMSQPQHKAPDIAEKLVDRNNELVLAMSRIQSQIRQLSRA